MDNTGNNNTIIKAVSSSTLKQPCFGLVFNLFVDLLHIYTIIYNATLYRLRYIGHIINLAVNSFLFVTDTEDLEEPQNRTLQEDLKEIQEQRRKGPLSKLHNIIVNIQSSPQHKKEFTLLAKNRRTIRDNKTRWNS